MHRLNCLVERIAGSFQVPLQRGGKDMAAVSTASFCSVLRGRCFLHLPPPLIRPSSSSSIPASGRSGRIVCMAHPRRVKMVAQQIKRELGDMLIKDKVLQHAMLPETSLGADMYLSSLATIVDVEVSKDLQVAKVYVSVYSDERGKEMVMEGLKAKTKYVRAGLGKRMQLRLTPEVRFIMDDSWERGSRVLAVLDRLRKEREEREAKGSRSQSEDAEDDDNWDDILDEEPASRQEDIE